VAGLMRSIGITRLVLGQTRRKGKWDKNCSKYQLDRTHAA